MQASSSSRIATATTMIITVICIALTAYFAYQFLRVWLNVAIYDRHAGGDASSHHNVHHHTTSHHRQYSEDYVVSDEL